MYSIQKVTGSKPLGSTKFLNTKSPALRHAPGQPNGYLTHYPAAASIPGPGPNVLGIGHSALLPARSAARVLSDLHARVHFAALPYVRPNRGRWCLRLTQWRSLARAELISQRRCSLTGAGDLSLALIARE